MRWKKEIICVLYDPVRKLGDAFVSVHCEKFFMVFEDGLEKSDHFRDLVGFFFPFMFLYVTASSLFGRKISTF